MENLEEIGKRVKNSTKILNNMGSIEKNIILRKVAEEIIKSQKEILIANEKDIENAIKNSMKESLIDRLKLDEKRIKSFLEKIADTQVIITCTEKIRLENKKVCIIINGNKKGGIYYV